MKKLEKILLVTVFFCILPVANLFALSKEATEAIEQIRARLHQQEIKAEVTQVVESVKEEDYVPGRELSAALARYRRARYEKKLHKYHKNEKTEQSSTLKKNNKENVIVSAKGNNNNNQIEESEIVNNTDSNKEIIDLKEVHPINEEKNTLEEKDELVASSNDEDVDNVSEQPKSQEKDELIIIEAMEADDSEAWTIPLEQENKTTSLTSDSSDNKSEYVPGQLLSQSVKRIRHSRGKNTPASAELDAAIEEYEKKLALKKGKNSQEIMTKANKEIEELFNDPEKRANIAEKERNRKIAQKELDSEEKQIDDDKFNDYISKYNFKMPENYRIIVD